MLGTKVAPSIWQRYISQTMANIPGVLCIFRGYQRARLEEHLQGLRTVLSRLQYVGLHIKEDKSKFYKTSIRYLGYTQTCDGLRKNENKAVTRALKPRNLSEIRSWIDSVNYYRSFTYCYKG